jgi:endo-1,4-beta-mannosidase
MTEISEVWHISEPQAKQAIQQLHKETNQNNLLAQLDQTSQKEFLDLNTNIKTELSKELQQFFTSLDRSELIAVGLQLFEYNTMTENLQKSLIYTTFLQTLIVDILGKDAVGTFGIDARQ